MRKICIINLQRFSIKRWRNQLLLHFRLQYYSFLQNQEFVISYWLSKTSDKLYFTRTSRDLKRIDLCVANTTTGEVTVLVEERLNTYVETRTPGLVNNGKEIIQWSERDGWAHFYLYDGNGNLKNQITSGAFHCQSIEGIDEKNRLLYFTANGRESGEDPYYYHLYNK